MPHDPPRNTGTDTEEDLSRDGAGALGVTTGSGGNDDPDSRGESAAELDAEEEQKVLESGAGNASVTHEAIRREGAKELDRSPAALAWSGLAAGLSMGLSLIMSGLLESSLPESSYRHLLVALGYPVGFLVVILGSQKLYTESTLTPIVPFMAKRTLQMARKVLTLWSVVFLSNMVGAFLFALAIAKSDVLGPELKAAVESVAIHGVHGSAGLIFIRAIAAGWIIALLVWMLPGASGERVFAIILMTWLISATELAHVIVGSVESFYLAVSGVRGFGDVVGSFILPAFVGNTLGGALLVGAVNHAQVTAGKRSSKKGQTGN